ncbi:NADH-quinone oxidoreductase subunit K [Cecembia sp.]|uniref:NADH-quinone oxidoreductase subunit K n=1 Tax=Cecembia sp. TaxID=1898110 RepID=UPI0025C147A7|nr:NADH-quinone oxidoreductase subunit K [Cecembia sp.]
METYKIYSITSVVLFAIGLGGLFLAKHFLRKIIATIIMGGGVFLCLVSFADRDSLSYADPVPHALVITGIVVAVTAAAFALSLARRIHKFSGEETFTDEK